MLFPPSSYGNESARRLAPTTGLLEVAGTGFGKASAEDIKVVLLSAASVISDGSHLYPGGLTIYHRSDHPQLDFARTEEGRFAIGLTARDTHWAQFTFQFAHEYGHALAGCRSQPGQWAGDASHANLWLEESLCETASLFTLRALSRSWRTSPPYPAWGSYAPCFATYAEQRLADPRLRLPEGWTFLTWFRENQPALRRKATLRDRNTIVAIRLLPLFEAEPRGWKALAFLHGQSHDADEPLSRMLADWRARCPRDLKPFIAKLAVVFGASLLTN